MTREPLDGDYVFAVHGFLSPGEREELIRRSRGLSWETGTVGGVTIESVRNNERVLFDAPVLAAGLFARARPFLPAAIGKRPLTGFNERWRLYRYGPGQVFAPHRDGSELRIETLEESHLTFMVYLNDGAGGGEPRFFAGTHDAFGFRPFPSVAPRAGSALVFIHRRWHEGGGDRRRETRHTGGRHVRAAGRGRVNSHSRLIEIVGIGRTTSASSRRVGVDHRRL